MSRITLPLLLSCSLVLFSCRTSNNANKIDHTTLIGGGLEWLQKDIRYLASDELEGRDTGTEGEKLAAKYIAERMDGLGISPAGSSGYFQDFEFDLTPVVSSENSMSWSGGGLEADSYYPLNFSGSGNIKGQCVNLGFGVSAPELGYDDYADIKSLENQIAIISVSSPDGIHPHSKFLAYHDLRKRAKKAIDMGADAVLFYKDDKSIQEPSKTLTEMVDPLSRPVLFVQDLSFIHQKEINLRFNLIREKGMARNVVGYLDKGKPLTVVIGAHYDHLGLGHQGSLHVGEREIHNGADDNASGVAAMLEIAHNMAKRETATNFLFIAFSGEERGLLGSDFFVKNPTIDLKTVNYMVNMDMVGRLDSTKNIVSINGIGTSPSLMFVDSLEHNGLRTVCTQSGIGPSDHTKFYLQDIPVLHFFSGTHTDYHKPTDDEHLINYTGIELIVSMIEHIISELEDDGELKFVKTKQEEKTVSSFKVTFGVMPDYTYEGIGFRIDGVIPERTADKSGLEDGDVVLQIGDHEVSDIYSYMDALGKFEPGDKTTVRIVRENSELTKEIQFD